MARERIPITRKRGDLYAEQITVVDKKTGLGKDITGNTFLMSVSTEEEPTGSTYLFQITGVVTDAANGVVEFTPSVSDADNVGDYFYDIQMLGPKETIMSGPYNVIQDITKD